MLIGNNEVNMNMATMVAALQHYFDSVLFATGKSPLVQSVRSAAGHGDSFLVSLTDNKKEGGDVSTPGCERHIGPLDGNLR